MKNENLNTGETANSDLGAVRRSAFIITIDDEYCKSADGFQAIHADEISIAEITKVLAEHFNTKMLYAKLVE